MLVRSANDHRADVSFVFKSSPTLLWSLRTKILLAWDVVTQQALAEQCGALAGIET